MGVQIKNHAKEYLSEFSQNQKLWYRYLITEAINTNGKISDEIIEKIYVCLKDDLNIGLPNLILKQSYVTQNVALKMLEHVTGVNALAPNQMIKFSKNITILYGLNGAGKSSYFKILNEIVGGNEEKDILSNIYQNSVSDIKVNLTYYDTQERLIVFDKSKRGYAPLTGCKVFDFSYLSGLLSQRTQTETILEPLGLHLFKYIVDKVDYLKSVLKSEAIQQRTLKPVINCENFSDALKQDFVNHKLSTKIQDLLSDKFQFTSEMNETLEINKSKLGMISQTNYSDRIFVLKTENSELQKIIIFLDNKNKLDEMYSKIITLINEKKDKEQKSFDVLNQTEILKKISLAGSKEWNEFIRAGFNLENKRQSDKESCIYCNQPLQDNALKLINAYHTFINDKSAHELGTAKTNLNEALKDLSEISIKLDLSKDIITYLEGIKLDNTDTTYYIVLKEIEKSLQSFKDHIYTLSNCVSIEKPIVIINQRMLDMINKRIEQNNKDIDKLSSESEKKQEESLALEKEIKKLLEINAISSQQHEIEKWINITEKEEQLIKKEKSINTAAITQVSNTAHSDLLTENLNTAFQYELDQLGYDSLDVRIIKAKRGKGTNSTKLILKDNDAIHNILSEGEQKAVGLALFLAEATVQKINAPIILDDPVNSLDHRIATNLANRLLSIENQIIIFNHNKLFQDSFETTKNGHICKTVDTVCNKQLGKHIFVYGVSSEDKLRKGVLCFYKFNTASNHIEEAKKELSKSPFTEHTKVAGLLRKAVECLIDEKILNGVTPTKYSNKNDRIHWDHLKKINSNPHNIEKLQKVHDRISGGNLHNGTESENNHIDVEEFNTFIQNLEYVLNGTLND